MVERDGRSVTEGDPRHFRERSRHVPGAKGPPASPPTVGDDAPERVGADELTKQFERRCLELADDVESALGRGVPYFREMLAARGAVDAATQLVHRMPPSETFRTLKARAKLDLTVESVVLEPRWEALFSDDDRAVARARLRQHGLEVL
ncbi:MAG: hypothetical protein OXF93_08895 [Acidobacteria bacterium]|nr:hypothetical protein [Acidobacteriota bacterium]